MTSEGASCSVKTVSNPYSPQTLGTSLWSGRKILLFRVHGHRINGQILTFHYLQKSWTWLHIPSLILWTEAVNWNPIYCGDITTHVKSNWSIGFRNTQPVTVHHVSKRAASVGFFPFMSTHSTYLHEERGDNNNNETLWFCLNESFNSVYQIMVIHKRPMDSQFINAHNIPISEVFNFNLNIQIGDASQVFYSTLYMSKSTQDEDSKWLLRIGRAVIKRIKRLLDENQTNGCDQTTSEPSFGEGLSKGLLGLNAATTKNVISSTMAHLISCNNGSWFNFHMSFQIC